ncbi:MAG: cytochrome c3 family protein [Planctomycetota bacterium]
MDSDYLGSPVCAECHAEVASQYTAHPMAYSALALNTQGEQPKFDDLEEYSSGSDAAGGVEFTKSGGRRYRVERRAGAIWHHEAGGSAGPANAGKSSSAADSIPAYDQGEPITLALGSGKRGRSYLLDRDGYLFMSPISWYSAERRWDLSPEYDPLQHPRFERPANDRCLWCHAGRVNYAAEPTTELSQRYGGEQHGGAVFGEAMIGCERCHGPGRRHVETHRAAGRWDGTPTGRGDPTIVQPANLDNDRRDAVCNQCHLVGEAQFLRYGRRNGDFRPGDRIGDIWAIFVRGGSGAADGESTRAVSHVEQMRASRCFQESAGRMSCTSCHDPHSVPHEEHRVAYFDERCQSCHEQRGCTETAERRAAEPAAGSCIACHMPRLAATDVPHTTQTDHRVRRRIGAGPEKATVVAREEEAEWQIFDDEQRGLPDWERTRARALLWAHGAEQQRDAELARRAELPLRASLARASNDVDVLDALAVTCVLQGKKDEALRHWEAALKLEPQRHGVLQSLAVFYQNQGEPTRALNYQRQLLAANPWYAEDHHRQALLLLQLGRLPEAARAVARACELNPSAAAYHQLRQELDRRQGRR